MNILNLFKSILSLAVAGVFLAGCAADQEIAVAKSVGAEQEVSCADVAGVWQGSIAEISETCMDGLQTVNFRIEILQDGCDVQGVFYDAPTEEAIAGKVEGNVIRWDGFYIDPEIVNIQPHDEIINGDILSGLMIWNITRTFDDAEFCQGRTETNATRRSSSESGSAAPEKELNCADIAGFWQHSDAEVSKTCRGGLQTFNYRAEILQDGCDVQRVYPGAEIKEPVAGKVEGNVIHWEGFPMYHLTSSVMPHDSRVNGDSVSGQFKWRVTRDYDGRELCFGRSELRATRQAR